MDAEAGAGVCDRQAAAGQPQRGLHGASHGAGAAPARPAHCRGASSPAGRPPALGCGRQLLVPLQPPLPCHLSSCSPGVPGLLSCCRTHSAANWRPRGGCHPSRWWHSMRALVLLLAIWRIQCSAAKDCPPCRCAAAGRSRACAPSAPVRSASPHSRSRCTCARRTAWQSRGSLVGMNSAVWHFALAAGPTETAGSSLCMCYTTCVRHAVTRMY